MENKMQALVLELNKARDAYYNKSDPFMTDAEYDQKFDELAALETETGVRLPNSPTQTVGYEVVSELKKVKHNHLMLSLDKTKSIENFTTFLTKHKSLLMLKMDGLTISLRYTHGRLVSAETRGNGEVGEDVLHTAKAFANLPQTIPFDGDLVVDGEAIISYEDFEKINSLLSDDEKYKNPRNLVSGSVRQLDANVTKSRNVQFIAWKLVSCDQGITDGFCQRLEWLRYLGFAVVPWVFIEEADHVQDYIDWLRKTADEFSYPIDGIVGSYNSVSLSDSLGNTSHHINSQFAFKFQDETTTTVLRDIEWSMGKTGVLTPVAIFDPVELEGTTVSRASLHNVKLMKELQLGIGDEITVYKANQIIPQVDDNLTRSDSYELPTTCPYCGVRLHHDDLDLICTNIACRGKRLGSFMNFVGKYGMDIRDLSENTLIRLLETGIVRNFCDIYTEIRANKDEISGWYGMGQKSVDKLIQSIEASRNCEMSNVIAALGIPMIGRSQAKVLAATFNDMGSFIEAAAGDYDFSQIDGFGSVLNRSIHLWYREKFHYMKIQKLLDELNIRVGETQSHVLNGKTFVITGKLTHFKNRDELVKNIETRGGKVASSVSKNTDYLINNDADSQSSKNKKARELDVEIITEDDYIERFSAT